MKVGPQDSLEQEDDGYEDDCNEKKDYVQVLLEAKQQ